MQKYEGSYVHGRNSDMPKNYKQDIVRREEGTTSPYTTAKVLELVLVVLVRLYACTLALALVLRVERRHTPQ
jgi:hypothetical protein